MMFPHKMTLFNKSKSSGTEVWLPTVLNGVLFTVDEDLTLRDVNSASSEVAKVYIPQRTVDTGGKFYRDPKTFVRCDLEYQESSFTFARGDYLGIDVIDLEGEKPSAYRNKNGKIYEIESVLVYPIGGLPSWVIVAR